MNNVTRGEATWKCLIVLGVLCLAGSAWAVDLPVPVKVNHIALPPTMVSGVSTVQIDDFSGWGGDTVAGKIGEALGDTTRGKHKDRVQRVDDGLRIDVFELVTDSASASIGGSVDVAEKVEDYQCREKKRDSEGNVVKDSEGDAIWVEVPGRKREVTVTIQWTMTSADDRVLAQDSFVSVKSDSRCGDARSNLKSREELATDGLYGAGYTVANTIAPKWAVDTVELMKNRTVRDQVKLANSGELGLAMCGLREVIAGDPYNVAAIYDLGLVHELNGWFDAAREYYQQAVSINSYRKAADGLERLSTRQEVVDTMQSAYGQAYSAGEPDYSTCPEIPEGRPVVTKKPTDLLSGPELGAPVVASLPKGMKLYVIDESGDLPKVQTADGAVGWVNPKHIK